jgi:Domain of unknown function (DUF4169)
MSGEVVNLNQARKKRKREEEAALAAANRARFGRTKQEKSLATAKTDLAARRLEGHRLGGDREASES